MEVKIVLHNVHMSIGSFVAVTCTVADLGWGKAEIRKNVSRTIHVL